MKIDRLSECSRFVTIKQNYGQPFRNIFNWLGKIQEVPTPKQCSSKTEWSLLILCYAYFSDTDIMQTKIDVFLCKQTRYMLSVQVEFAFFLNFWVLQLRYMYNHQTFLFKGKKQTGKKTSLYHTIGTCFLKDVWFGKQWTIEFPKDTLPTV